MSALHSGVHSLSKLGTMHVHDREIYTPKIQNISLEKRYMYKYIARKSPHIHKQVKINNFFRPQSYVYDKKFMWKIWLEYFKLFIIVEITEHSFIHWM